MTRYAYATLLLLTSQMVAPAALAQVSGGTSSPTPATNSEPGGNGLVSGGSSVMLVIDGIPFQW